MLVSESCLGSAWNRGCDLLPFLVFCEDDIVKSSTGPKFAMYFTVTPVAERTSIAWTYVAKDYENIPDEETRQFEDMITLQDVPIVESQRPELLPSTGRAVELPEKYPWASAPGEYLPCAIAHHILWSDA